MRNNNVSMSVLLRSKSVIKGFAFMLLLLADGILTLGRSSVFRFAFVSKVLFEFVLSRFHLLQS